MMQALSWRTMEIYFSLGFIMLYSLYESDLDGYERFEISNFVKCKYINKNLKQANSKENCENKKK